MFSALPVGSATRSKLTEVYVCGSKEWIPLILSSRCSTRPWNMRQYDETPSSGKSSVVRLSVSW